MKTTACQMEVIYRDGGCGKPAVAIWELESMPVCKMCACSVALNGGTLLPLETEKKEEANAS